LCFQAQQAAEKAIKAVYVANGIAFRYTHDLTELLDRLTQHSVQVPDTLNAAAELSVFAWESRYPVTTEPSTKKDLDYAILLAKRVIEWAETYIKP